ncbi:MAG: hypothetical protein U0V73_00050 [Acidimicrobiia bacterium]
MTALRYRLTRDLRARRRPLLAIALLLGVAGGIALAAGRVAWTALADSIGAVADPVVPWAVLLLVPGVVVVANLVAIWPARRAARVVPATALRSE